MSQLGSFSSADLDRLQAGIRQLPEALKSEMYDKGLERGGQIIKEYVEGSIVEKGLIDTHQLVDSVAVKREGSSVVVAPRGTRDRSYKSGHSDNAKDRYRTGKAVRNAEVAFIYEYGTSKQRATHVMSDAADASVDDVTEAVAAVLDDILQRLF